jgi:hypothetical protein
MEVATRHDRCWANALGACASKMSREHYVSKAFFSGPAVTVQGFSWCKTEPKTVSLAAATAKILCEKHNSSLSPLDAEAASYMRVVRQHLQLTENRSKSRFVAYHIRHFSVNAQLLERWLLKVLLNLCFESKMLIGLDGEAEGMPALSLVQICFGQSAFQGRAGMYVASYNGMSMEMGEALRFSPLVRSDNKIVGGFFTVAGVNFFLSLDPLGPPSNLAEVPNIEDQWLHAQLQWKFREIKTEIDHRLSHVIRFKW